MFDCWVNLVGCSSPYSKEHYGKVVPNAREGKRRIRNEMELHISGLKKNFPELRFSAWMKLERLKK